MCMHEQEMLHHKNPEKAKKYLAYLDDARCRGKWAEVPELARKIEKHDPGRKCLVLAARAEAELILQPSKKPLTSLRAALQTAVDTEHDETHPEDIYQARTYLASRCYSDGDKDATLSTLPSVIPYIPEEKGAGQRLTQQWTYICVIKNAYVRDMCRGPLDETRITHQRDLDLLASIPESLQNTSEYQNWAEKLVARLCAAQGRREIGDQDFTDATVVESALAPYRAWSKICSRIGSQSSTTPRSRIWRDYYLFLSKLLADGYIYPSVVDPGDEKSSRLVQSTELRHVEEVYESVLMREVQFPEASTVNAEIEEWADQLMANWSITCGSTWQDDDLGKGGQEGASRRVLDKLYRAATRTFHSTPILRHLFAVHTSLAEFDLASKALDSYLDIVVKGRSRVEKSGQPEPGLDDETTMLLTTTYGISMLCEFGRRDEASKSEKLAKFLENWLEGLDTKMQKYSATTGTVTPESESELPVANSVVAQVHRAVAISKANWGRFTFEAAERADLQASAIRHFRQSLIYDKSDHEEPKTLYALALILAETRDVEAAIATVKQALSSQSRAAGALSNAEPNLSTRPAITASKISLVGCWHLLALLLSSRQDFEMAENSCEAAVESFDLHGTLPGELGMKQLSFFEKRQIIEAKMTQILLCEITEGPDIAVNTSEELLALYTYIFDTTNNKPPPTAKSQTEPPSTANTMARGLRESVLGRSREPKNTATSDYSRRISADTTRPPTISVTDGDHLAAPRPTSIGRSTSHKLQKSPSKKSIRKNRGLSPGRSVSVSAKPPTAVPSTLQQTNGATGSASTDQTVTPTVNSNKDIRSSGSQSRPVDGTAQLDGSSISKFASPVGNRGDLNTIETEADPSKQNPLTRKPPFRYLPPRMSAMNQERYILSLLTEIWIFIAGLYRRAGMFEDAGGAIDEAFKLAKRVETNAATFRSSAMTFDEAGWGSTKSVDETWADAYTEAANLGLAQGNLPEATARFETALSYHADHPNATIGLSNLLLDVYEENVSVSKKSQISSSEPGLIVHESSLPVLDKVNPKAGLENGHRSDGSSRGEEAFPVFENDAQDSDSQPQRKKTIEWSPERLDQLAARDRAYGLLSSLTKLGTSWDNSEAWYALARAYEDSGQIEKAKEILWWVVDLEDKKPIREWRCLGQGYSC